MPKLGARPIVEIITMEIQGWITQLWHLFRNAKGEVTRLRSTSHSLDHYYIWFLRASASVSLMSLRAISASRMATVVFMTTG